MNAYYDDLNLIVVDSDHTPNTIVYDGIRLQVKRRHNNLYYVESPQLDISKAHQLWIDDTKVFIQARGIVKTSWFEKHYDATNEELGASVQGNKTLFSVWAPTAQEVLLSLERETIPMQRKENGTYWVEIQKNCHEMSYHFKVMRNGRSLETTDPYAKASLPNRLRSVVVDFKQIKQKVSASPVHKTPLILEMHVRDFSMDPNVPFKHRGQFKGLLESHGDFGMHHVVDLGMTHIQLMPVNDFETVDELDPLKSYNWGYDPMQFMALEGSYSSNVQNPIQVLEDFRAVVDGYHKVNIGVNLDVVFNHVYDIDTHPFHILVPYYYFRYFDNYELSNGSFCGNEVASEMPMARKIIVDTCVYFVENFKVDGYRFDLMGLLDIDTMQVVVDECRRINPYFLIYGEGWSMPTPLPHELRATLINASKILEVGHFNDQFRNTIGGDLDGAHLGFTGGDLHLIDKAKAALTGNAHPHLDPTLFLNSKQSVNYVECHDNLTAKDRIIKNGGTEYEAMFMIAFVLFAQGIPFLQIGQSFYRGKKGVSNSYQSSDEINRVEWHGLKQYHDMNEQVKSWIALRKDMYQESKPYHIGVEGHKLVYNYGEISIKFDSYSKRIKIMNS